MNTKDNISPAVAQFRADFMRKYIERDRQRALKKYHVADVIDFKAKTGIHPRNLDRIRAQFTECKD